MNVLLVGFGWFGKKHYKVWKNNNVKIMGIVDKRFDEFQDLGKESQDEFHVDTSIFNVNDLIEPRFVSIQEAILKIGCENIDVVDIVTNEGSHYDLSKWCLSQKMNIIVEKPFVLDFLQTKELVDLAIKNNVKIFVGHLLRFDIRNRYIKDKLNNSKVLYASFLRNFQKKAHDIYGNSDPLYTALIHDIDLIDYFFGIKNVIKSQMIRKNNFGRVEADLTISTIEFEDGLVCNLENHWYVQPGCPYGFENEIRIYTESETIHETNLNSLSVVTRESSFYPDMYFWPDINDEINGALNSMLMHYANCIETNVESNVLPMSSIVKVYKFIDDLIRRYQVMK